MAKEKEKPQFFVCCWAWRSGLMAALGKPCPRCGWVPQNASSSDSPEEGEEGAFAPA